MTEPTPIDVFLSHNSHDKPLVEQIARRLIDEAKLRPFLDKWHLTPGEPWQSELENALGRSKAVAVFIGPTANGPWHHEELQVALMRAVREKKQFRVIPVLLPNADTSSIPAFLQLRTSVDFREGINNDIAFKRLVAGILGKDPEFDGIALPAMNPIPTPTSAEAELGQSPVGKADAGIKGKTVATLALVAIAVMLLLWGATNQPFNPPLSDPVRFTLEGHEGSVSTVFTPDSRHLISWEDDQKWRRQGEWQIGRAESHGSGIRLWDVKTGKEIKRFYSAKVWINSLVIAPDGKSIAAALNDGTARLWALPDGDESVIHRESAQSMTAVAFSPDSATLAVGTNKGIIKIFDWKAKKQLAECKGHGGSIIWPGFFFSKDGRSLISAASDDSIRLWDVATGKKRVTLPDLLDIWDVRPTHNPDHIMVIYHPRAAVFGKKTLSIVDLRAGRAIKEFPNLNVDDVAMSADAKTAYKVVHNFYLHAFDVVALIEVCRDEKVHGSRLVFLPESASRMLVSNGQRLLVYKVDGFTYDHIRTEQEHTKPIISLAVSPDGAFVATGDESGIIKLWNATALSQAK